MESNVLDNNLSRPPQPKNWLVESILVTLFCCLPFGIAGIINASKVDSRYAGGDYEGAERSAAEAKKWTKIGFIVGLVGIALYFLLIVIIGVGAAASHNNEF